MSDSRRRSAAGLLGLLFLLTLPLVTPRIFASDEIQYYAYLRSFWFDRDVSFANEYEYFHEHGIATAYGFKEVFIERRTETGKNINFGTVGSALLWAPFYAAGDLVARASGGRFPADGYSTPYVAAVCIGTAIYGLLGLMLSLRCVREILRRDPDPLAGFAGAAAVWFGTPLAFYMYLSPVMAHATSAFTCALFLLVWLRVRRSWSVGGVALLGACAALMVMVREQDAFYLPMVAIDFTWSLLAGRTASTTAGAAHRPDGSARARRMRMAGAAIVGSIAGLVVFVPQALAYLSLNGRVGPSRLVSRKMFWDAPFAWDVLFSPEHGFFLWTPLALVALGGAVLLVLEPERRRIGLLLLTGAASHVYVAGSLASWSAAGAFGQRRFVSLTPLLVIGMVVLLDRLRGWRRWAVVAVTAVCVYWNVALMFQFGAQLMDRHRLDVPRAARVAFIELPTQLPRLTYRFLFERSSYFAPPHPEK